MPRDAKPTPEQLQEQLTPEQFRVTQQCGTEPPFQNEFWNNKEAGLYVDVVSGEALFVSQDKFDSGSGWPSFVRPIEEANVVLKGDTSAGMQRVEVRSKQGDSHLGHVFNDGPGDNGLRYCINSASLRFVPEAELETEGYGAYTHLFAQKEAVREVAVFAGGCFWGVEELLRRTPGVVETEVGYTGGSIDNPTYEDVKAGGSGHAESIRVVFDPNKLTYADLLRLFFRLHDPTTKDQQGNDRGSQYRSAIFVGDAAQRATAEEVVAEVDASGKWPAPVVTEIVDAKTFYPAEDYHQDYLVKNPNGYTCHWLRD